MKIACSCEPTRHYNSPAEWRVHYDNERPSDIRLRANFVRKHSIQIVDTSYKSQGGVRQVNTTTDLLQRLKEISRRVEAMYGQIIELEEERVALLKSLEPIPPLKPAEWIQEGIKGTCKECGRKTTWKLRGAYHCRAVCRGVFKGEVVAVGLEAELRKILEG